MNYEIGRSVMKCGSYEAEYRCYHKYIGKSGRVWLVADQPNAADNVYVHDPKDKHSDGFGGATLTFKLVDGSTYSAKGPWHTNSSALFGDTGIDVRNCSLTFVVLAMDRIGSYPTVLKDVVYMDEKPTLGNFYRYRDLIAQRPEAKYYYSESAGGSSCGPITEHDRKPHYSQIQRATEQA